MFEGESLAQWIMAASTSEYSDSGVFQAMSDS